MTLRVPVNKSLHSTAHWLSIPHLGCISVALASIKPRSCNSFLDGIVQNGNCAISRAANRVVKFGNDESTWSRSIEVRVWVFYVTRALPASMRTFSIKLDLSAADKVSWIKIVGWGGLRVRALQRVIDVNCLRHVAPLLLWSVRSLAWCSLEPKLHTLHIWCLRGGAPFGPGTSVGWKLISVTWGDGNDYCDGHCSNMCVTGHRRPGLFLSWHRAREGKRTKQKNSSRQRSRSDAEESGRKEKQIFDLRCWSKMHLKRHTKHLLGSHWTMMLMDGDGCRVKMWW